MAATKRSVCYFLTHKMMPALFPFRTGQTMMTSWGISCNCLNELFCNCLKKSFCNCMQVLSYNCLRDSICNSHGVLSCDCLNELSSNCLGDLYCECLRVIFCNCLRGAFSQKWTDNDDVMGWGGWCYEKVGPKE